MGTKPLVLLLVGAHRLMAVLIGAAHLRVVLSFRVVKVAVNGKEIRVKAHREDVLRRKIAFAKRKIVDSIKEVGFAATVFADNAVDVLVKRELSLFVAFEIR